MKVIYLASIPTPFQVELAMAVNNLNICDYHIIFAYSKIKDRGEHWRNLQKNERVHVYVPGKKNVTEWIKDIFKRYKPRIVFTAFLRGPLFKLALNLAQTHDAIFGIWAEHPIYEPYLKSLLRRYYYRQVWKKANIDFLMAIGDRAVDVYREIFHNPLKVFSMPYIQDLSPAFEIQKREINKPIRFLFSGRLIPRNSIREMTEAFIKLSKTRPNQFTWCISASGSEEKRIIRAMENNSILSKAVYFHREFKTWNDRLRPFADNHILIVPAVHSGWGLVVPEALAAGMPVITTRAVEAARYYVEHMVNGIFIEPKTECIYNSLEYCIDFPEQVKEMQKFTKKSACKGHIDTGAKRFANLMKRLVQ